MSLGRLRSRGLAVPRNFANDAIKLRVSLTSGVIVEVEVEITASILDVKKHLMHNEVIQALGVNSELYTVNVTCKTTSA